MLQLIRGDITKQTVEAIVNAANSRLGGGGGVDGAIHRAGGPIIAQQCQEIVKLQKGCPAGEAVITDAGNLHAKYVIHAVGPIWHGGTANEEGVLAKAYQSSLELAKQYEIRSIAFPSISTGAYGFPLTLACPIAIKTITDFLKETNYELDVRLVLFDAETYSHYDTAINDKS